jgi:hypothetical protein
MNNKRKMKKKKNKENVVDIHDYSAIKKHEILSFVTI